MTSAWILVRENSLRGEMRVQISWTFICEAKCVNEGPHLEVHRQCSNMVIFVFMFYLSLRLSVRKVYLCLPISDDFDL